MDLALLMENHIQFPMLAIATLAMALLSFVLGLLVYRKDPKAPAYRAWLIMNLCIGMWALILTFSFMILDKSPALFLSRTTNAFALFIPITYLHFVMRYVNRLQPKILRTGYLLSTCVLSIAWTPLFVVDVSQKFGVWYEIAGPAMWASLINYLVLPFYGILMLSEAVKTTQGIHKTQLKLFRAASIVGFSCGVIWYFPGFQVDIPPTAGVLVSLYSLIMLYSILRYRWMKVRLAIQRSLVYSILVSLLTAGYFSLLFAIEHSFQSTFGYHSIGISLSAFAIMAFLFQPLKTATQRGVDWLIFREPQEVIIKRMERLQDSAQQAEKFKAISTLAAGMAHEIKNPLTVLKTYGQFLTHKQNDPVFIEKLRVALDEETTRMHQLVQEVLQFSKPREPEIASVDIGQLVDSTVHFLSTDLGRKEIQWEIYNHSNGAQAQVDSEQIRQILINLIQNAADAMSSGNMLTTTVQQENGHIEVRISDTGKGIPTDLLPKIFDPFVTTKPDGNGLGLAMVYSMVKANRGTITAENNPDTGATFIMRLPT